MIIEIAIGFLLFVIGYLIGRVDLIHKLLKDKDENRVSYSVQELAKPTKPNKRNIVKNDTPTNVPPKISIDESKFVTTINTDSFQKDFEDLGEKSVSKDDIGSSISKLSQMKRNKE